MSWSVTYGSKAEFYADNPNHASRSDPTPEIQIAINEQVAQGRHIAKEIIESGVVGDHKEHDFTVNLYGHANAKHQPAQGWANDTVTVTVSQKMKAAAS